MTAIFHIVTVDNIPQNAKAIMAALAKEVKNSDIVHIANCESIKSLEHVLSSLITPPEAVICSRRWFEDEEEEMRELSQRLVPGIRLIMVPCDLTTKEGYKSVVEYLKEQVGTW